MPKTGESTILTIPAMLQASFRDYAEQPSLVGVGEENRTYAQLEVAVKKVALQLQSLGVRKGDRVALLSANMPQWGMAFLACGAIGAVAVPILPDFHRNEIRNILQHAGVTAAYVSENLRAKLEPEAVQRVIRLEDFTVLADAPAKPWQEFAEHTFAYPEVDEDDLLSIIYTSGTTGQSKGVMLSHKNVVWTAQQSWLIQNIGPGDRFLSVLPLAHTYENTLGLILPLKYGAAVYYLQKPPAATVLLAALQQVKPTMILLVPLIIEKIYKTRILAEINGRLLTRALYPLPPLRRLLNRAAGRKLRAAFGGHLKFFGVGGAKLDPQVERFLVEGGFPLAIGYGMTEASPLLAGSSVGKGRLTSTGPSVVGVQLRIAQPDQETGEGEVQAKGPNVMQGYYREPRLTAEAFTADGWLRTGDLGCFDREGNLYLKGRIKNMIVAPSGKKIFPEEIESIINRMEHVLESLVVQKEGRLVALVHLNLEALAAKFPSRRAEEILKEIQDRANEQLSKFSRLQRVLLQKVPFEKTPTQKIKRFLYAEPLGAGRT